MRTCAGVLVLTIGGCNWVYGLSETKLRGDVDGDPRSDLDRDGIKDVEDPCIAPETDVLGDYDRDSAINSMDACPFDAGATADADGDGIPDACDPIPRAGDRVRCVMTFSDPDLDVAMWRPRDQSGAWTLHVSGMLSVTGKGSIAAAWPFEGGASTTYDIAGSIGSNLAGNFDVLARAGTTPAPTDVGCRLEASSGAVFVRALPGGAAMPVGGVTFPSTFRIQMTFAPAGAAPNLRCAFRFPPSTSTIVVSATVDDPAGHVGFSSDNVNITTSNAVRGIAVYERADASAQ